MPKALIADNNKFYQDFLGDVLSKLGFSVVKAGDGMEALEMAKVENPDIFILDLVMPKIDGQRLCRYLRKIPRFQKTPIVITTGIAAEMLKHEIPHVADAIIAKGPAERMQVDLNHVIQTLAEQAGPLKGILGIEGIYPREIVSELLILKAYHDVLLSSIAEGVLQVDQRHKIYYVNHAVENILEQKEENIIGHDIAALFGEAHQSKIREIQSQLENMHQPKSLEIVFAYNQRMLRTLWSNLRETWEQEGYIVIIQDITVLTNKIHHLMTLNEMGKLITSVVDYPALLSLIMGITQEALNVEAGSLFLVDEAAQELVFEIALGPAGQSLKGKRISMEQGIIGWVVREGKSLLVADAQKDSRFYKEIDKSTGFITHSMVCAPVIHKERIIGAIQCINKRNQRMFTQEDLGLLESIAAYSAIAIENSRLYTQLKDASSLLSQEVKIKTLELAHSHEDLLALYELVQEINQSLNLQKVLETSLKKILEITRLKAGALFLLNEKENTLGLSFHQGLSPEVCKQLQNLSQNDYYEWKALAAKTPVFENQLEDHSFMKPLMKKEGFKGLLCIPLIGPTKPQGVISLGSKEPIAMSEVKLKFLLTIGTHIAAAIENARLCEELQRANIQLLEMDRMKSDFVTTISHNIRTPLTAITGYAQMLEERLKLGSQDKEILDIIIEQSRRLLTMTQAALSLTRIEAGEVACFFQEIMLEALLPQCITPFKNLSSQHQIILETEPGLPLVRADEEKLCLVIENLISNAIKYSPQGGPVEIKVKRYKASDFGGEEENNSPPLVLISVKDCGLGIVQRDLDKVFEKYTRLEEAQSQKIKGAGVGLYICKKAIEAHGGKIWTHSEPGKGSTFYFTLPAVQFPQ